MPVPRKAGILLLYNALPDPLKAYFTHFPKLLDDFPPDVALSYLFAQVELAHNMSIYCGVVKKHGVDSELAKNAVNSHHMTRTRFRVLYGVVMSNNGVDTEALTKAKFAESVRDKILHGKQVKDEDKRAALVSTLEYSNLLNEQAFADAQFRPFGKLQGFKGAKAALDKSTSRWVLMGMGIMTVKKKQEVLSV